VGRFINDDHVDPNLLVKIVEDENLHPLPVFVAKDFISANTEISYYYGNAKYPWRHKGYYLNTIKLLLI